ncbi:MAG: acyl dehydratase [Sphingopyxis macrogoltabida]|uniref:Acyl dehydratase n=1 Tax=Sphingopyxis macrogoltabida TaxID=33050 RepID=A0A2W5L2T3_SPHMC|nr:MAG: acyl dehydratase [Sphingopyxis macrogoltabida]
MTIDAAIPVMGHGPYWQELAPGQQFRTFRRTITETDLVNFISCTGMLEVLFIDDAYEGRVIDGRLVPAALTYTLIEGFQMQTLIQGVGLALLEVSMKAHAPVMVGDTVEAVVTIDDIRATSRGGRGVVRSTVEVTNQRGELVLSYVVSRLVAGQPDAA